MSSPTAIGEYAREDGGAAQVPPPLEPRQPSRPVEAVYRARDCEPWQDVEIVGRHAGGFVLRETGKVWPGVFVASLDRVRIVTGAVLEINEFDGSWRRTA
jgi:hypothetical protein